MRAWMALAVLLVSHASPAGAQPQAFLALVVNDMDKGEVVAVFQGDRIWLPVAALEQAGLRRFEGQRDTMFGAPHVLLTSLEPGVLASLDMRSVTLRLQATPAHFDETRVALQRARPEGIVYSHSLSGFLNYNATWDHTAGASGFGQLGVSFFGNTSLSSDVSVDADGRVLRGLTTAVVDRVSARQRFEAGDFVTSATPLGSGPTLLGLSIGRDYSVDPYYFRYPGPFVHGTTTTPSDVEIYVNGALVRRLAIPPGPYRFDQLPLNTGRGDVRVVVRDRLGRLQTFASAVYLASGVMKKGDQDYQYAAGRERDDTEGTPKYLEWAGAAYHRVGVTNWLTAGYAGEGDERVVAGGPSVSMRVGRLGEIGLEGWASRTKDDTRGFAFYGLYTYASPWFNVGATAQYFDGRFANLFLDPGTSTTPEFYQATAGVPVFGTGSLNYTWDLRRTPAGTFGLTTPDGSFDPAIVRARSHSLRGTMRLFAGAQLTATGTLTDVRGGRQWSAFAALNVTLWGQTTASVTYSNDHGVESTFADIDRPLPVGPGYAYRLTASDVDGGTASGQLEANLRHARIRATYDASRGGEQQNAAVSLAGGVVVTGGGFFLTRELQLSSAVVEVSGLKGVRVLADNVPIGRTNGRGQLLLPELLPYLANRISIDESDIPFDRTVPATAQLIAPPFRGAARVRFITTRIQARSGAVRMSLDGEDTVPAFGTISVPLDDRLAESPLNAAGEFFLDLPDGRHTATVTFMGRSCTVQFDAVAGVTLVQQLGMLRCAP